MADPTASTLLAVSLVAAIIRIATYRQPRWRVLSAIALATMVVGMLGLILVAIGAQGWSWLFDDGELGSTPTPGP